MTQKHYNQVKKNYIEHIEQLVKEEGGIIPHLSIFADKKNPKNKEEKRPSLIHILLSDEFMTEEGKEKFINKIVPELFKEIKREFTPVAIAWTSEAWMRSINKEEIPDDWKKITKKEVVIINIESKNDQKLIMYNVKREGMQITSSGKMVDTINLELIPDVDTPTAIEGRFAGLFKKFDD
jgi:hypothetical protein